MGLRGPRMSCAWPAPWFHGKAGRHRQPDHLRAKVLVRGCDGHKRAYDQPRRHVLANAWSSLASSGASRIENALGLPFASARRRRRVASIRARPSNVRWRATYSPSA